LQKQSLNKIKEIFVEVLKLQNEEYTDSLSYLDYDPWDSVTHMKIVAKIEQAFDIEFEMRDIIAMETVAKVKEIVAKQIKVST
tara:strand:+ start:1440 stop:1688 length:249 start_codon:yes stop_codon:yes gene_type:complete